MRSKQIQVDTQTLTQREFRAKLYYALRQLRTRLTHEEEEGVMAYHIFTNSTMNMISHEVPRNKEDLLECPGIGNVKMMKYGDRILETIESTIREHYNVERRNTKSGDEEKPTESNVILSKKRATGLSNMSTDAIFGANLLCELAKYCKKKSDVAQPGPEQQSAPTIESYHEAGEAETTIAAPRQERKRKRAELETAPEGNNSTEERAEELSSVPCRAETSDPRVLERFMVSFPPASEAPDIMSRMCPPEAATALGHLPNKDLRVEAARSFALSTYHVGNLLASHESLEESNTRRQSLIEELSREKSELSKSTHDLKGEIEKLKSALQEKEDMEVKLKEQLREAEETHMKKMDEARVAWKRDFLESQALKRRIAHYNAPIYRSGLTIGMRQAVKRFKHLHGSIQEFEPNPEDFCEYQMEGLPPYSSP